jgi:hypothetical protein
MRLSVIYYILVTFIPNLLFGQIKQDTSLRVNHEPDTLMVPFEEIEFKCLCIPKNKYLIIDTYTFLNALLLQSDDPECKNIPDDEIDFDKEAIIGFFVLAANYPHFPYVDITMFKVVSQKKYVCKIMIKENRNPMLGAAEKKVLIFPKPEKDYEIEIVDSLNCLSKTFQSCWEHD